MTEDIHSSIQNPISVGNKEAGTSMRMSASRREERPIREIRGTFLWCLLACLAVEIRFYARPM